jgi:hypothetical protein
MFHVERLAGSANTSVNATPALRNISPISQSVTIARGSVTPSAVKHADGRDRAARRVPRGTPGSLWITVPRAAGDRARIGSDDVGRPDLRLAERDAALLDLVIRGALPGGVDQYHRDAAPLLRGPGARRRRPTPPPTQRPRLTLPLDMLHVEHPAARGSRCCEQQAIEHESDRTTSADPTRASPSAMPRGSTWSSVARSLTVSTTTPLHRYAAPAPCLRRPHAIADPTSSPTPRHCRPHDATDPTTPLDMFHVEHRQSVDHVLPASRRASTNRIGRRRPTRPAPRRARCRAARPGHR